MLLRYPPQVEEHLRKEHTKMAGQLIQYAEELAKEFRANADKAKEQMQASVA